MSQINHALANHLGKKSCKGGNIGIPVLELPVDMDYYVIEMSSYQIEKSRIIRPDIGVILNISPDHIEHHNNLNSYIAAKIKLLELSKVGIFTCLDEYTSKIAETYPANENVHRLYWSQANITQVESLPSPKNSFVSAYALALVTKLGITKTLSYFKDFKPLPYRVNKFHNWSNIEFINDSKATNLAATLHCLNTLKKDNYTCLILLIGGALKAGDKQELEDSSILNARNLKFVVFGQSAVFLEDALAKEKVLGSYKTLKEATKALPLLIDKIPSNKSSTAVVLSPIGASFDEFDGYHQRGETFDRLVKKLF